MMYKFGLGSFVIDMIGHSMRCDLSFCCDISCLILFITIWFLPCDFDVCILVPGFDILVIRYSVLNVNRHFVY
ncbi:unnamed protein product [Callosobruchus maculatus]|uniref:Uncharacterized protein n=1 Tax=Callosobruchus maculatus TaxID=64391 RepID=A0A653C4X7_CALMS|nr:unnamed protein product [Callosobruchus maculatus]